MQFSITFSPAIYIQSIPVNESGVVHPLLKTYSTGVTVQNQALSYDTSILSTTLSSQANQLRQTNDGLVISLLGIFGAFFVIIYFIAFKHILSSITRLQEGTKIIGSGNLDYSIVSKSNDEVGDLSKAFNQMTANLKTVTASKTDLEQAQASLRESEQRWATTLASIGDAVIATDLSGKIMFMNREAEELTGWTLNESSLKPVKEVFNIINEQTRLEVENPIEEVLREGMVVGLANHTVLIRKDGSEVPIDDSGAPIKDKEGKTTGVVLIFRDITERKKAEEAVESNRLLLETITNNLSSSVALVRGRDLRFLMVNPAYQASAPGKQMVGKTIPEVWPETQPLFAERCRHVLETGEPFNSIDEMFMIQRSSDQPLEKAFFSWLMFRVCLPENGEFGILITLLETTERKKVEEALGRLNEELEERVQKRTQEVSSERQRLYNVLETLPAYVVLLDKDYRMPFANKVFRETFGESHGRRCHEYLFGRDSECENCETYKVLKTNEPQHWEWTGPNGHDYEIYDYPFVEADGSTLILEMGLDVTEHKKAERQAQEATKKLQDSERLAAIGATAGMVGHDIRNPLQAITGDLYLAKEGLVSCSDGDGKKEVAESLLEIEKNIDYINKIVQDLQDYARPLNPHAGEADLKLLIEKMLQKNSIPDNVKVSVKVDDEARKFVADADYLNRILYNLVINAVQAMPKGGKLSITAHKEANGIVVAVKDTGVGIPKDIQSKMFTPMFTTKSKGQGFGLPVVKRMTESLGGTVSFESQEGKGTTFKIRLPSKESNSRTPY